jgi:DNA adenine methylase
MKPFLAWVGSKSRISTDILRYLKSENFDVYIEPFLGSGSIGLELARYCIEMGTDTRIILSDANDRLMNVYVQIRDNLGELIEEIDKLVASGPEYYTVRDQFNDIPILDARDAAMFIWLNKNSYKGLYRVSKAGKFNVPKGVPRRNLYDIKQFSEIRDILQHPNVELRACDYTDYNEKALYYLDPPYVGTFGDYCIGCSTDGQKLNEFIETLPAGSRVYVSNNEKYTPPNDSLELFSKQIADKAARERHKTRIEKLFLVRK